MISFKEHQWLFIVVHTMQKVGFPKYNIPYPDAVKFIFIYYHFSDIQDVFVKKETEKEGSMRKITVGIAFILKILIAFNLF